MGSPTLYLVCGLPGAGKTTRARQIVEAVDALYLEADEWVLGLGLSLVDYEFRIRLQQCLLAHAGKLLRRGVNVVLEFGSWSREERAAIRDVAVAAGAVTELHYLDAPLTELVQRVRARGGRDAETLASKVLLEQSGGFERPAAEEIAVFDRFVGPEDTWAPR